MKSDPPDSTVYVKASGQSEKVRVGKTPLQLTAKQMETEIRMNPTSVDFIEFSFEKQGYQTEVIKVPPSQMTARETTIQTKLKSAAEEGRIADTMIKYTLNAQKLTNSGDFERALFEIEKALEVDSRFSQGHAMKGNIYFLKGDYEKSLASFEKANFLDPANDEVLKMITYIRSKKLNQKQVSVSPSNEK